MSAHILSIVIAFIAYTMLDSGKVVQKHGLVMAGRNRSLGILLWVIGTIATSVSSFLILYAVSLGSVLIVGAMAGTGLASVTLYSVVVLREKVGLKQLLGVCAILIGPFLIGAVTQEAAVTPILIEHLFFFAGSLIAL